VPKLTLSSKIKAVIDRFLDGPAGLLEQDQMREPLITSARQTWIDEGKQILSKEGWILLTGADGVDEATRSKIISYHFLGKDDPDMAVAQVIWTANRPDTTGPSQIVLFQMFLAKDGQDINNQDFTKEMKNLLAEWVIFYTQTIAEGQDTPIVSTSGCMTSEFRDFCAEMAAI
jgi:hypothetical protein